MEAGPTPTASEGDPTASPPDSASASPWRAWWVLTGFSFGRHLRVRQMVGIAVGLMLLTTLIVALITGTTGWDRSLNRLYRHNPFFIQAVAGSVSFPVIADSELVASILAEGAPLAVFSRWVVFFLFLGFLMPLWTLSFATSALGTDRESRSLVWLLTRPIPRSGVYLAKFLGVLPWCLALNLGGFALLCLAGGEPGRQAWGMYWPAVLGGTLAFTAAFHLVGALFARPAVVALLYAFFFETILSELPVPGTLKRFSINYYARCLMYGAARADGVPTESAALFAPVSETTAWAVLLTATVALTAVGMALFARTEYRDEV